MIYLDNNATTMVKPQFGEAIYKAMMDTTLGNPSSTYELGKNAKVQIEQARKSVADSINADPEEIIFTSGATEGNNLAIRGYCNSYYIEALLFSAIEHPSVYNIDSIDRLEDIKVNTTGVVDLNDLKTKLKDHQASALVSIMLANNETGVIQPIEEISDICKEYGAILHVDATQAYSKMIIDVKDMGINMLTASGHKFGLPKGIGFLYKRRSIELEPLVRGGHQEDGARPGTENVPYIVGLGEAAKYYNSDKIVENEIKYSELNEYLRTRIKDIEGCYCNTLSVDTLPNTLSIRIESMPASSLVALLSQQSIYVSAGSACSSGDNKPSHVLLAMGLTEQEASETIRISFNEETTMEELDAFVNILKQTITSYRIISKNA